MNGVFTLSYLLNVVCVAIGFFTFIKLVSNDVYLSRHRILPTIAGIITVYDFYLCIIPFVHSQDTVDFLYLLCDMCALVIMFMMFFYFLFIKTPKNVAVIITIAVTVMIALCLYDFIEYYFEKAFKHIKRQNYDFIVLENSPGLAYKLSKRGYKNIILYFK